MCVVRRKNYEGYVSKKIQKNKIHWHFLQSLEQQNGRGDISIRH